MANPWKFGIEQEENRRKNTQGGLHVEVICMFFNMSQRF